MTEVEQGIGAAYFMWLYQQAFGMMPGDPAISYVNLCTQMHRIMFDDRVPNDDNRTADGKELRDEFISTLPGIEIQDYAVLHSEAKASILEVFVGLARHADYMVSMGVHVWVRRFLENLGLLDFSDANYRPRDRLKIVRRFQVFNDRTYTYSGEGGIFPLNRRPRRDQRRVELWYQMAAYMTENQMY